MEALFAITAGSLFGIAAYLMLSRDLIRFVLGFIVLGNAVNLALFAIGRTMEAQPALIPVEATSLPLAAANPLPQALILTAIVIGFGLLAFTLVLLQRGQRDLGTLDSDRLRVAEPVADQKTPPR